MNEKNHRQTGMERLLQRDRILLEARMLPTKRKLTKHEHDAVRAALRKAIAESNGELSEAVIANRISYSASVVNQWLHNKYPGRGDAITHAVNRFLELHAQQQQRRKRMSYVTTWVCEEMFGHIRLAYRRGRMAAIVAPSGSGKDIVIDALCEELYGFKIECHRGMTARELLIEIDANLRIGRVKRKSPGSSAVMVRRIVEKIREKNCVIFLNEAQQLRGECASVIRTIHDQTGVPIIMVGSQEIFEFIDDRSTSGGQFSRRTIRFNAMGRAALAEDPDHPGQRGRKLFSKQEVLDFIASKRIRLAQDDADHLLYRMANIITQGTLGLVNELIETVIDMYGDEDAITRDRLVEAAYIYLGNLAPIVLSQAIATDDDERAVAAAG